MPLKPRVGVTTGVFRGYSHNQSVVPTPMKMMMEQKTAAFSFIPWRGLYRCPPRGCVIVVFLGKNRQT